MKIAKTFRLSVAAIEVLDQQENATQYVEELITGKAGVKVPWLDLERRIDELKLLLEDVGTPRPKNPQIGSPTANLEELKKQTGMITAEELNYEPTE